MSKKILNPQRRRFLRVVAALYAASLAGWVVFYLRASQAERSRILWIVIFTFCFGFAGIGFIVVLWRRFPVPDGDGKNEKH